jgi:hypothetical protein
MAQPCPDTGDVFVSLFFKMRQGETLMLVNIVLIVVTPRVVIKINDTVLTFINDQNRRHPCIPRRERVFLTYNSKNDLFP